MADRFFDFAKPDPDEVGVAEMATITRMSQSRGERAPHPTEASNLRTLRCEVARRASGAEGARQPA